jgi:checkpoint serine/threonine-protein kinase
MQQRCLHVFIVHHTAATLCLQHVTKSRLLNASKSRIPARFAMHPSSTSSSLDQERRRFQQQITELDVQQEEDPLDIYYQFAQWLDQNYPQDHAVETGLVDLLEEATKVFLKVDHYKSDLRYLKLWVMYARHVEDPGSIYSHLLSKSIGTTYALLYEEYSDLLERTGR